VIKEQGPIELRLHRHRMHSAASARGYWEIWVEYWKAVT